VSLASVSLSPTCRFVTHYCRRSVSTAGLPGTYTPPYGYYCSNHPPRGTVYRHRPPMGLNPGQDLPNAPYANATGAVIQTWMPEHWYSNQYLVGSQSSVRSGGGYGGRGFFEETAATKTQAARQKDELEFTFTSGGFQGNIGTPEHGTSGEWYIENVLEELDAPTEFFYDGVNAKLYYVHNSSTGPPPASLKFAAVTTKVLLNYSGTQSEPITNVSVQGITLRDTAYTYLDPHGAPSGGDWAIQRTGAITIQGTRNATISSSLFTRLDGLGVFIRCFNLA